MWPVARSTVAPADVALAELSIADFERFGEIWNAATSEERVELLGRMIECLYVDFERGQVLELVPKAGFRYVFVGAGITKSLTYLASDRSVGRRRRRGLRRFRLGFGLFFIPAHSQTLLLLLA